MGYIDRKSWTDWKRETETALINAMIKTAQPEDNNQSMNSQVDLISSLERITRVLDKIDVKMIHSDMDSLFSSSSIWSLSLGDECVLTDETAHPHQISSKAPTDKGIGDRIPEKKHTEAQTLPSTCILDDSIECTYKREDEQIDNGLEESIYSEDKLWTEREREPESTQVNLTKRKCRIKTECETNSTRRYPERKRRRVRIQVASPGTRTS